MLTLCSLTEIISAVAVNSEFPIILRLGGRDFDLFNAFFNMKMSMVKMLKSHFDDYCV